MLFAVLLGACVSSVNKQAEVLSNLAVCCGSFEQLNYIDTQSKNRLELEFVANSDVFMLEGKKSYIQAIVIPESFEQKNVSVKSLFNGLLIGPYLEAQFIFLDATYSEIETIRPHYTFYDATFSHDAHMLAGFRVPIGAKYAIIYAKSPYVVTSYATMSDGNSRALLRSPIGELVLDFY